ncbi:MAG: hypothetical protein JWO80_4448 [Bryobacterales bacterium]|nr:hypothetical protein [Bryobacterales bacterium]
MLLNNTEEGHGTAADVDITASSMRSGAEEQYNAEPPRSGGNEEFSSL